MPEKLCFVIMPFSKTNSTTKKQWDNIYKNIFKPAIEESGFEIKCKRNKIKSGAFIRNILEDLSNAFIVLADLTDLNANVFYELGVRHTLTNKTIMVTQSIKSVPSDLKYYGVIEYSRKKEKIDDFKRKVKDWIDGFVKKPDQSDNPVSDFLKIRNKIIFDYEKKMVIPKITSLITETSWNIRELKRIEEDLSKKWSQRIFSEKITLIHIRSSCLELLLTTQYFKLNKTYYSYANRILNSLNYIQKLLLLTISTKDMNEFRRIGKELVPSIIKIYEEFAKEVSKYLFSLKLDDVDISPSNRIILYCEEHGEMLNIKTTPIKD